MIRLLVVSLTGAMLLTAQDLTPRSVPPPGVKITDAERQELQTGLKHFGARIQELGTSALLPDVRIYHEAVRVALTYDEFFRKEDVAKARELMKEGQARVDDLQQGRARWTTATGLIVRGYVSKVDGSVQPYGLVVPTSWSPQAPRKWRLDCWLHGRSETLNEISFLYDRERNPGEFTPRDTIVLHLYGRYNNASKFAGEADLFEAIEDVRRNYNIDENRILIRGFSMGGASVWHLAAHHAGEWAANAPGAGFSETQEYTHIMNDPVKPTWWEQKLWHLYNATDYAANIYNCPMVAYSGEIDKQKQAADMMEKAMAAEGMRMTHIIGPQTPHRYHPDSKVEINRLVDAIAERGREPYPRKLRFTTWTLRYNRMKWITVDALDKHWERARLDAEITPEKTVRVKAENVTGFTVEMGPGAGLLDPGPVEVVVNGQTVKAPGPMSGGEFRASLERTGTKWAIRDAGKDTGLRKRHGLQGPIDDAFMDSFVFVKPTGQAMNPGIMGWVNAEQGRAIREWRRHFRGEPRVKNDAEITDEEIASSNLVLWGDPGSNKLLARILDKLPLRWTASSVSIAGGTYKAGTHVPVLIYPNPLNPKHYVVLNSGITYRESDYLTNAREVPKLPDWAVIDTTTPPDTHYPGKIISANFFDEQWKVTSEVPKSALY